MVFYNDQIGMTQDEFVLANQLLVHEIIHKNFRPKLAIVIDSYEDLAQIGMIGLIKAYQQFDLTKTDSSIKPTSYAYSKIASEISTYLKDKSESVRFPREFYSVWNFFRNSNIVNQYDFETIAEQGNFKLSLVERAMPHYDTTTLSLNYRAAIGNSEGEEIGHLFQFTEDDLSIVVITDFVKRLNSTEKIVAECLLKEKTQVWMEEHRGINKSKYQRTKRSIARKLKSYMEVAK